MNLGKIFEYAFRKDDNTSWVIDSYDSQKDNTYSYNTLKLYRPFSFVKNDGENKTLYYVSVYIQRECEEEFIDSKLTFSKIKSIYVEENFYENECDKTDILLSSVIDAISSSDVNVICQDVQFRKPLKFKAQGLSNFYEKGKTKPYYIVGIQLENKQ